MFLAFVVVGKVLIWIRR